MFRMRSLDLDDDEQWWLMLLTDVWHFQKTQVRFIKACLFGMSINAIICTCSKWTPTSAHAHEMPGYLHSKVSCVVSSCCIWHSIHVWYIYLHLVDFCGKRRYIYHTWILWVWHTSGLKNDTSVEKTIALVRFYSQQFQEHSSWNSRLDVLGCWMQHLTIFW